MTNRIQTLRSSVAGNVPTAGTRQPGELWLNFADNQIGYIDASKTAQKLQAVRFFSTLASYAVGDCVWNAGVLYSASVAVSPGAFNPLQWTLIGGAGTGFLPLSGGTLTGPLSLSSGNLSVSAGNISASGSGTFGSIQTATINATGAVATGALTTTGNLSVSGTGTFGGQILSSNNGIVSKGVASFVTYDRGNSGGNTTQALMMYRDANIGRFWMDPIGDVLTFNTSGAATFNNTVSGGAFISQGTNAIFEAYDRTGGGQAVGLMRSGAYGLIWMSDYGNFMSFNNNGTITIDVNFSANGTFNCAGVVNAAAFIANYSGSFPIQSTAANGQYGAMVTSVAGVRTWYTGCWSDGTWYAYDASIGLPRLGIGTDGSITGAGSSGAKLIMGNSGYWEGNSMANFSMSGGVGCSAFYGGASSGGWAIYARTDSWATYNMLIIQDSAACGSITSNGSNSFFNTSCDARLKSNIRALTSEIDVGSIIDALKPVAFEWRPLEFETIGTVAEMGLDDDEKWVEKTPAVPGKHVSIPAFTDHGFIAQDLYQVLPGIVHKPEKDDLPMMADYSKMVPYLVAELQALRKRVAQLEAA